MHHSGPANERHNIRGTGWPLGVTTIECLRRWDEQLKGQMHHSFTKLPDDVSKRPAESRRDSINRNPSKASILFLPIYLPLLVIAHAIPDLGGRLYRLAKRWWENRFLALGKSQSSED
jgi:hypothetical protein